jgi:FkbM family methyltransferase
MKEAIAKSKFMRKIFNKIGGVDYGIYSRNNIIVGSKYIDYFVMKDGAKYKADGYANLMIEETRLEYDWSDIRSDDIILDVGANVGGFTIAAALKAKHVYAIEPIFYNELEENIKLNNLNNVTVLKFAIGDGHSKVDLSFNKVIRKDVPTYTFNDIFSLIRSNYDESHNVTFLKCDCEGYEWYIKPKSLNGIRRIEMEIHPNMFPYEKYNIGLIPYIIQNWDVKLTEEHRETYMLHAFRRV